MIKYNMNDDKYAHFPNCRCGKHKRSLTKDDPWYIDSPKFYNCFFTYMRYNNRPHTLQEVAKLLKISISLVISSEKRGLKKAKAKYRDLIK